MSLPLVNKIATSTTHDEQRLRNYRQYIVHADSKNAGLPGKIPLQVGLIVTAVIMILIILIYRYRRQRA